MPVDTYDNQAVWKGDAPDEFAQRALTAGGAEDEGMKKEVPTEVAVEKEGEGKVESEVETVFNSPAPTADTVVDVNREQTAEEVAADVETDNSYNECD